MAAWAGMLPPVVRRWRREGTQTAFENDRLRVLEDAVLQPDGSPSRYTVIEDASSAVVVVPVADDGRLLVVWQHRYPIDTVTLELPAGEVPTGVDPLIQARCELSEETGVTAARVAFLGRFAAWPSRLRRWSTVVVASGLDLSHFATSGQDASEFIEDVGLMSSEELRRMISSGELIDGPTLCALNLYWAIDSERVRTDH